MDVLFGIGKLLIIAGLLIAVAGVALLLLPHVPFLGKLPGDILISRDNVTVSFPLATLIIVSVVLTILLNLLSRFFR